MPPRPFPPLFERLLPALLPSVIGVIVVPFLVWIVASNNAQDARISALEIAVKSITSKLDDTFTDLRNGNNRLDDKLSALLIQGYRTPAPLPTR